MVPELSFFLFLFLFYLVLFAVFFPLFFRLFFLAYAMASTAHFPDPASFQQQANGFINWLGSKPGVRMNSKIGMPDLGTLNAQQGAGTSLIRR